MALYVKSYSTSSIQNIIITEHRSTSKHNGAENKSEIDISIFNLERHSNISEKL
jgi:hypothetical protein